ncbi:heterokaryon incompatibility protein-domain-containing protein [Fusarium venenatum]|uniref:heterokaryon incompatibility protein-domain-containing protein n=1 Tax=Fusarium venenatum TaxID=56646 RepID=UPI001E103E78|nr:heterokaryon incompatibility protein-domain-containing protein [Fusarium venenatum]
MRGWQPLKHIGLAITFANDDWEVGRIKTDYSRRVTIHERRISLKSSAETGCIICRQVWKQLLADDRLSKNGNNSPRFQQDTNLPLGMWVKSTSSDVSTTKHLVVGISSKKHLDTVSFTVIPRTGNSDPAPKIVPNAHLSSTSEAIELWHQWFYTCSVSHSKCRTLSDRPMSVFKSKRLVEIINDADGNHQQWRLVLGAYVQDLDYLTLSHCWGWTKHLSLTKHNYHVLKATSLISTLPTTYRDALVVTAALGKQYIWIDSLCILQDDEEDWKSQSSVMGLIYKYSACNVAAAWAENSSNGCFSPKEAPTIITLASTEFFVEESLYSAPFHQKDIWDAPLNKRAWMIQERYLVPRHLPPQKNFLPALNIYLMAHVWTSVSSPTTPTWSWINLDGPVEYDRAYVRESADTKLVEVLEASIESNDPNRLHSFVSSKLRLRGIALWGFLQDANPNQLGLGGYLVRPSAIFKMNESPESPGKYSITNPTITLQWDEYQLSLPKDSQRYQELLQQRTGQLLILPVGVNQGVYTRGLLLRHLKSVKDEVVCVRLGVVDIWGYDFAGYFWERLGLPKWFAGVDRIDLNDPLLNGLVQEVTIQ